MVIAKIIVCKTHAHIIQKPSTVFAKFIVCKIHAHIVEDASTMTPTMQQLTRNSRVKVMMEGWKPCCCIVW